MPILRANTSPEAEPENVQPDIPKPITPPVKTQGFTVVYINAAGQQIRKEVTATSVDEAIRLARQE